MAVGVGARVACRLAASMAQRRMAAAIGGGTAFPTPCIPRRLPSGSYHVGENPMRSADSCTLRQRTVVPCTSAHVSG